MATIAGVRDGHLVLNTVTGKVGSLVFAQQHHPECPCQISVSRSARVLRRRRPTIR